MVQESSGSSDRDRQVNEIITAYLEAVDAGQTPDRQEWLRRYPEFAAESVKARPVGAVERLWRWWKRHPAGAALLSPRLTATWIPCYMV
jgi:hypothetical protein